MTQLKVVRTDFSHSDFQKLVEILNQELLVKDGEEHSFYAPFNQIDSLKHVVVVYQNDQPLGCGSIKPFSEKAAEVKRMFVLSEFRGQGIAQVVLKELEKWALELGFSECVLETGKRQVEALRLYQKSGYTRIPNYGQYQGIENSICMQKTIV